MADACNIKVAIRVRQLIEKELQSGQRSHWTIKENSICCIDNDNGKKHAPYMFDQIFDQQSCNMDVFEDICQPIVISALEGFHGTIFVYGQSSSGKTFTMSGTRMQPGIIRLSIEEIFNKITDIEHREFLIRVGYIEIYNENVTDLLSSDESTLKIREDQDHNVIIAGIKEEIVNSLDQVIQVIKRGDAKRHTAETKQNDRSSRSHCILRLVIESKTMDADDEPVNVSHLHFVDLAGSEKAAENTGDRFKEGCAINKSLFTLGNVIRKLSGDDNMTAVSLRDSKLTRLLTNALGGNSKTAIICTITPASVEESISTLQTQISGERLQDPWSSGLLPQFASRAKVIKNKPEVNEVMSDTALFKKYRREIQMLKTKITELEMTDTHMEKTELEKKLMEKEQVEQKQLKLIQDLKKMVVISGAGAGGSSPAAKKRRRETWCPGKAASQLKKAKPFLPILEEISPPPEKKSTESTVSFKPSKTLPLETPDMDASLQLLDDVPEYKESVSSNPFEDTIHNNPAIKQVFELEDKVETLREDLRTKELELRELQEFTTLERQVERETIENLQQELKALKSNLPWLEDELMKTQQERNRLRTELESKGKQLMAVEDGSGLSERNKQLLDAESRVESLTSDMDVQKSRYEFHMAQMKSKLESYTKLLEESGVRSELIKQRTGGDLNPLNDSDDLVTKHEQEINELRNEVDSYVQRLEKEQRQNAEIKEYFEVKLEQQNQRYHRDLKEMEDEREVFRKMFEEERAKDSDNTNANLKSEMDVLRVKYEEELCKLNEELQEYKLLAAEKLKSEGLRENENQLDTEDLKRKYEEEITVLHKKIENYAEILKGETKSLETDRSEADQLRKEIETLKQCHENETSKLKEELDKHVKLLEIEKERQQSEKERIQEETDGSVTKDHNSEMEILKEKYEKEINILKAEINKYVDLISFERDKFESKGDIEDALRSEITSLKQSHSAEVQHLQGILTEYEETLAEERLAVEKTKEELDTYMRETSLKMEKVNQKHEEEFRAVRAECEKYLKIIEAKNKDSVEGLDNGNQIVFDIEAVRQKYEAEIEELRDELDQLRSSETESQGSQPNDCGNLSNELLKADYEQTIKDLKDDLEMYKDLLIEEQSKNAALEMETDVSVNNFGRGDIQDSVSMTENSNLQTELFKTETNLGKVVQNDLQSELLASEMERMREKYETEIEGLREELEQNKASLEHEKQKNKGSTDQGCGAAVMEFMSEGSDTDVETLKSELENQKQLLNEVEMKFNQLEEEQAVERNTFDQQRAVFQTTINDAEEDLHNLRTVIQRYSTESENFQNAYESLKADKIKLLNEKCELEEEIQKLKQTASLSESMVDVDQEIRQLREDKESLEKRSVELIAEINSIKEDNANLEKRCAELSAEAEELKEDKYLADSKLEEVEANVDSRSKRNEMLEKECREVVAEMEIIKSKHEDLQEEIRLLNSECQELKSEKERLEELNIKLQQEKDKMLGHKLEEESEKDKLETGKHDMEKQIQILEMEVERQESEKRDIKTELETLETVNSCLKEQSEKMLGQVESLEAAIITVKEENAQLKEEMEMKIEVFEETLQELKGELHSMEETNMTLRNSEDQKSNEISLANSEIELLKSHINELENDAQISAELVAEYESEVKQLKEKIEELETFNKENSEKLCLDLQEKYEICVDERDGLIEQLREKELNFREEIENCKTGYEESVGLLREENDGLHKRILEEENENEDLREKLVMSESKKDSLLIELKMTKESSIGKEIVEELQERLSSTEVEKSKLIEQIQELRNENISVIEGRSEDVNDLKEKLRLTEIKLEELKTRITVVEEEKAAAEKSLELLKEEKISVEEDLYQAEKNRARNTLQINTVESYKDWEEKWDTFVKTEKRKRIGLLVEMRDLKEELEKETERRKNAIEAAMERARKEVRDSDMYKELNELYKKADDDANILHSKLEDEKANTKKLEERLANTDKLYQELKQKVKELETNAQSSKGSGFVEGNHSCNFRLETYSLQRKLKESESLLKQRDAEYAESCQMQEDRIARLKNEIRRIQSLDNTMSMSSVKNNLDFSDSASSSAKEAKKDSFTCGSSSSGGIIDHYRVVVMETEKNRLLKENKKQAAKLAKLEEIEKENIALKQQLEKAEEMKKKTEEIAQNSEPRNPLEDVVQQTSSSSSKACIFLRDSPQPKKPKLRFDIPDLEPKKQDKRLTVDGEDLGDNCKQQ